jgi:UDP-glucose 4-epimerase
MQIRPVPGSGKRGAILVTGGAGYIGSHVVKLLGACGERIVVLDDLSTGFAEAVLTGELVVGDVGDRRLLQRLLRKHGVQAIIHFAAHTVVPESVRDPLKYYDNNACKMRTLLDCAVAAGVRHFVFSSTAAVYGTPPEPLVTEDSPTNPINPYGASKLMSEWMLRDVAAASGLRHATLRYFNVAGCDPSGRIGQSTPGATLLIKVACQAALGARDHLAIYGTDFPTADGTGVRDYIHVEDLADAHRRALAHLRDGGESLTLNCGYGHGYSVREVIDTVQRVSGTVLKVSETARRPGDPPALIADSERIRHVLGWRPRHDDLEFIVRTTLDWERQLLSQRLGLRRGKATLTR